MHCCIPTPTTDSNTRTGMIWVALNMPSAVEDRQGISHCLESGHPVIWISDHKYEIATRCKRRVKQAMQTGHNLYCSYSNTFKPETVILSIKTRKFRHHVPTPNLKYPQYTWTTTTVHWPKNDTNVCGIKTKCSTLPSKAPQNDTSCSHVFTQKYTRIKTVWNREDWLMPHLLLAHRPGTSVADERKTTVPFSAKHRCGTAFYRRDDTRYFRQWCSQRQNLKAQALTLNDKAWTFKAKPTGPEV